MIFHKGTFQEVPHETLPTIPLGQLKLSILDGRQELAHFCRDLHAFFPVAIVGTIPMQCLAFAAAAAIRSAAAAHLAHIALQNCAAACAGIANVAKIGPAFL